MSRLAPWKAAMIAAAFVASPLVAAAQTDPQSGQQPPQQQQQQPPQQPPATAQPPQGQSGNPTQGTDTQRQAALTHLTAARQDLADITKLPAATQIQGQARNDLNQLITNFNALITSNGPEWRQAYDNVQNNLTALLGREPAAGEQAPVGTSGGAVPSLDPAITAKLSDLRPQIDQFGEIVGVQPGQSAVAQQQNPQGGSQGTSGTSGINEQALRTNIDQIGSIVSRLLSQGSADQPTIAVNRQDLQQIQQDLDQLRQSLGQPSGIR